MAYRSKYAAMMAPVFAPKYSPTGLAYPTDPKSQTALLKPYGMITANEMGHIGGGIVRRLVQKGRMFEYLERIAQEQRREGEASVFLLFIGTDGKLYFEQKFVPIEKVGEQKWQDASQLPIPQSSPIYPITRTPTHRKTLGHSVKLAELKTEAKKTQATHLLKRLGPKLRAPKRQGS